MNDDEYMPNGFVSIRGITFEWADACFAGCQTLGRQRNAHRRHGFDVAFGKQRGLIPAKIEGAHRTDQLPRLFVQADGGDGRLLYQRSVLLRGVA